MSRYYTLGLRIGIILASFAYILIVHAQAPAQQQPNVEKHDVIAQWEDRLKKNPSNILLRERLGEILYSKKQFERTIKVLAPYSNEITPDGLRVLAQAYDKTGELLNEIRALEMYKSKEPDRFRPHYMLGIAYKKKENYDEAVKNLRRSVVLAGKHRPSYDALVEIFKETKQSYENRILINDMIRIFGSKPDLVSLQCELYINDGFLEQANQVCKEAVKIDPKIPANHIHYAQSFVYQDNKKAAERVFITAARQFPNDEYVQWSTGEYYYQNKNYPIAVRYLKQAVKVDPKSARTQLALALSLFEGKNYNEALPHFIQACQLEKGKVTQDALRTAGATLMQARNDKSKEYERAIIKCF